MEPITRDADWQILNIHGEAQHIKVDAGSWLQLGEAAAKLRTAVFVREQGIAPADEWDAADISALHVVVRNKPLMVLATGRLIQAAPGVGRIGRMAVVRNMRGCNLGALVLNTLVNLAQKRGDQQVILHAQRSAEAFYAKSGFVPQGAPFDEVGIAHIEMVLTFN